jgi:predicted dehydrogenase
MFDGTSRRSFLATGAAAGAAALAGRTANAQPSSDSSKYKIGVLGLDYTFWGIWANILQHDKGTGPADVLNIVPTHVWDKDPVKAREWADKWGWEVVDSYDGMVGKVDAVVNGELYNIPWQHKLMRPYLEAGIPCYLQRPWSNNLRNLDTMLELAARYNAPVTATATYEHYDDADTFQKRLANVGEIQTVLAQSVSNDRPHFHIPYMMMKILGYDVEKVSLITDNPDKVSYLQSTYIFKGGEGQKPYACVMQGSPQYVYKFEIVGKNGVETGMMPSSASHFIRFFQQLMDIQRTIETREHYQPLDIVRKKFQCVQAEYFSHYERGGAPVDIGSVPVDWSIPARRPDWYSDSDFKD